MNKIRKDIPFIDQHDENGMWGNHGGTFCGESLKKTNRGSYKSLRKIKKR